MAWAWFLVLLAAAAVIVYSIWNFRKKTAAREAASAKRFEEMLRSQVAASPGVAAAPALSPTPATPATASAPAAPPAPIAKAAAVSARERFLGQPATLLYYLLKTGLPDHEIFANVSLASMIAAPAGGGEREQHLRRLAPYQLDFVVCDKSMRIVAAIDIDAAVGADAAGIQQFKADCLKQAGVRLVRVNPGSMPRREQLRTLIGGGEGPAGTGPAAT